MIDTGRVTRDGASGTRSRPSVKPRRPVPRGSGGLFNLLPYLTVKRLTGVLMERTIIRSIARPKV